MPTTCVAPEASDRPSVVELIYRGAVGEEPWTRILPVLCARIGCQAIGLRAARSAELDPGHAILDPHRPTEILEPAQWQHVMLDDPIPYREIEPGKIYRMGELVDPAQLRATSFYRELLEPAGYDSFLCTAIRVSDSARVCVFLYRNREAGDFSDAEAEVCRGLLPHIELALRLRRRVARSEAAATSYGAAIASLGIGAIVLARDATILSTNANGAELLRRWSPPIQVRENRFGIRGHLGADFDTCLARILSKKASETPQVFALSRPGEAPLGLLLRACPGDGLMGPRAVVYLGDPTRPSMPPPEMIAELFGLSPAEARLACQIAAGQSLADAASELGLSEASIRTYSKRIYSKVGVRRQAELVRLLLRSVGTLGSEPG